VTALVYHVGNLARDRLSDPALDALAELMLARGTTLGQSTRPRTSFTPLTSVVSGLGEGYLTQRRLAPGLYEYRFTPRRS
jgi:hypothetical protein